LAVLASFALLFIFFAPALAETNSNLGDIIPCEGNECGVCDIFNEANKSKGTNAIWAAVWGILITFGAYVIVNAIIGGLAGNSFSESWYQFPGCAE